MINLEKMRTKILAILIIAAFIAFALWVNFRGDDMEAYFLWALLVASIFVVWLPLWKLDAHFLFRWLLSVPIGPLLCMIIGSMIYRSTDGRI
jgi:hypothetical protein